jgi:hypothetical protein
MHHPTALANVDDVKTAADKFFQIADLLHRRLTASLGPLRDSAQQTNDLYSLLVEEYGLRARASILRNDAAAHLVLNARVSQASLLDTLTRSGEMIIRLDDLAHLRSIIAGVSTLCVSISPGKGRVVDFLEQDLQNELSSLAQE